MKTCNECKFAVFQDDGYSNYTVEGTTFQCRKEIHPDGDFDRFYGTDTRLEHASLCAGFVEGASIDMDVEREGYEDLTAEQKEIYDGTFAELKAGGLA